MGGYGDGGVNSNVRDMTIGIYFMGGNGYGGEMTRIKSEI